MRVAKRGKKPEEYGQLALFEEKEPEWLKPANLLGYSISNSDSEERDAASDSIFGRHGDAPVKASAPADDDDDLVQFAEWLVRKRDGS